MYKPSESLMQCFFRNKFFYNRYEIMAENIIFNRHKEMDICGGRKSGFIDEIEIKLSRSDFLADFKKTLTKEIPYVCGRSEIYTWGNPRNHRIAQKYASYPKHVMVKNGESLCNYFSFFMPEELANKCIDDLDDHHGMYVFMNDGGIIAEKKPKLLHRDKISGNMKAVILKKLAFRHQYNLINAHHKMVVDKINEEYEKNKKGSLYA